jgi:hypothetical protein
MATNRWAWRLGTVWWLLATLAWAESPLNPVLTLRDNLRAMAESKKPVVVVLANGQSYRARIGSIGEHAVVLTELAGKEYFDALVPLEAIVAVEVRARGE